MNENATMNTDVIEELSNRYLLFRIDEAYYGLSLTSVREIIQVPKITDIPGTPEYVKGIINLRGEIIPIIALHKRFNIKSNGFTIFELNEEYKISSNEFLSMGKATPFEGWKVNGRCLATVCDGKIVYKK